MVHDHGLNQAAEGKNEISKYTIEKHRDNTLGIINIGHRGM